MATAMKDVRAALVASLRGGLEFDGQISPYVLKNPSFPTIWTRPSTDSPIEYHQSFAGPPTMGSPQGTVLDCWHMMVDAYVSENFDIAAQQLLDEFMDKDGVNSIKAALEADRTLGGIAQDLNVRQCVGFGEFRRAEGSALIGAQWTVDIYPA